MKFIILGLALSISGLTFAVTDSEILTLSAVVGESVDIAIAPEAVASNLDLHTTQADLKVATASESSNAAAGYQILANSSNNGAIKHSSAADSVAYTISYAGGGAVSLTTSDQVIKTQGVGGVYSSVPSDVNISYTGVASAALTAGSYSDTITFTIESL